jgi:hypothetical protein
LIDPTVAEVELTVETGVGVEKVAFQKSAEIGSSQGYDFGN